jgi:hypothetical protein
LHALANVDTRLSQIDGAIAEMTKRVRTNGVLDAINSQRKARAELVTQRRREAEALTRLKTEQAAAAAKGSCSRARGGADHVRGSASRRDDGTSHPLADTGDGAVL